MLNTLVDYIHKKELRCMGVFGNTVSSMLQYAYETQNDKAIDYIRKRYIIVSSCDRQKIFETLSQSLPNGLAIYTSGRSVINGNVKKTSKFYPMSKTYWVINRR